MKPIWASLTLQENRSIHDSMNITKIEFITYFLNFIIDIYYIEIIYHFGNKTVLFLICNRINSFVERKAEQPV